MENLTLANLSEKQSHQIQQAIMDHEIAPISHIYIDLMCLKDYRLGSILSRIMQSKDNDQYQYLIQQLPTYNARLDRDLIRYFPELPYTDQELDAQLQQPKLTNSIYALSPTTKFYDLLPKLIFSIKKHNDQTDHQYLTTVVINTYPLQATPFIKHQLEAMLRLICPQFRLGIIQKPLKQVAISTLYKPAPIGAIFKLMFIWDIFDMIAEDGRLRTAITSDMILQYVKIAAPRLLQTSTAEIYNKQRISNTLKFVEGYYNIFSIFNYLDFSLPVGEPGQ